MAHDPPLFQLLMTLHDGGVNAMPHDELTVFVRSLLGLVDSALQGGASMLKLLPYRLRCCCTVLYWNDDFAELSKRGALVLLLHRSSLLLMDPCAQFWFERSSCVQTC